MKTCPTCGSWLLEEPVRFCEDCGSEAISLVARILYGSGDYSDVFFCGWPCVFSWLRDVATDHVVVLPSLKLSERRQFFEAARIEPHEGVE